MPFCTQCTGWSPLRAAACLDCGGELTPERPPGRALTSERPAKPPNEHWDAVLPSDQSTLAPVEVERVVTSLARTTQRARGLAAAPESWLPEPPHLVASALGQWISGESSWRRHREFRHMLLDLQLFVPDEDAEAAQRLRSRSPVAAEAGQRGFEVLDRIRRAQAVAICMLREDDRVLGAHNALRGIDIVVGRADRSLAVVDEYKEAQALGFVSLFSWPAGLVLGGVIGTVLAGLSVTSLVVIGILAAASWAMAMGPMWARAVGVVTSRAKRLVFPSNNDALVAAVRTAVEVAEVVVFFGGPVVLAVGIVLVGRQLGLA